MQRARRTNPYPWTWEIPAVIIFSLLLLMAFVLQTARSTANMFAGGGWRWPPRADLFSSIPRLLGGDASTGIQGLSGAATSEQLWIWSLALEASALAGALLGLRWAMVRWGPGRMLGMASAAEVEQLLGSSRLLRNAAVVRPDLYGPGESR